MCTPCPYCWWCGSSTRRLFIHLKYEHLVTAPDLVALLLRRAVSQTAREDASNGE